MSIVYVPAGEPESPMIVSWQMGTLAPVEPDVLVALQTPVEEKLPAAAMYRVTGVVNVIPLLLVALPTDVVLWVGLPVTLTSAKSTFVHVIVQPVLNTIVR
jgi:hypothetical protein